MRPGDPAAPTLRQRRAGTRGEISAAARVLGVARNTLYSRIRRWDLDRSSEPS